MGDHDDRDDVKELCDDSESFGRRDVEGGGLWQQHARVASIAYFSKSFVRVWEQNDRPIESPWDLVFISFVSLSLKFLPLGLTEAGIEIGVSTPKYIE
jgi:hypothetical protein